MNFFNENGKIYGINNYLKNKHEKKRELICLGVHSPQNKSQKGRRYIGIKKTISCKPKYEL